MLLRRANFDVTAHGFCNSFRDWAGNETHFPRELAEHALAHVTGDRAEQAYRRSDALARRRELMDAWAKHCEDAAGRNVVTSSGRLRLCAGRNAQMDDFEEDTDGIRLLGWISPR